MVKGNGPSCDGGSAANALSRPHRDWRTLAVLALLLSVFIALNGAPALAEGRYDPRTWVYDSEQHAVIGPSGTAMAAPGSDVPRHSPIPRRTVAFTEPYPKGTILIDTSDRRLYYVLGDGKALQYAVGVGKEGFSWSGRDRITDKREWPDWRPPTEMRQREQAKGRALPAHVPGGPDNPLGARALYIGSTLYRIHGTNQPWTVGTATSSGCIRMVNEDVIHLYNQVAVGTQVVVRP
ncbi:L,D-transpeptidase [Nitratireductor sp. ZSWI3]|uniref:L,D-transpeptidase n=1 Tax=Nitratireductor sp. ZSWI3 TaxID=2966359 RepID=UPI002150184E|nr:L,D-transpeptidase [Nitratireductor sp. ZSWI3]MCR4264842.1 L,D-transpeptidase [Nitratireductor sp. ZSWI3]